MLRDGYYLGRVTYQGVDSPGRHEPLISQALFDRVQGVLDTHAAAGERSRRHPHYLKGTQWCASCQARGIESRMILQRTARTRRRAIDQATARGRACGRGSS